jgi:hypothetical protein
MADTLLQRQARLLEHLTSAGAIFGEGDLSSDAFGFHRGLLHLEAKYSHQKRMEKIEAVLPRTLALLGAEREATVRAFAETNAPDSISRLDNARQFHQFLLARQEEQAAAPAWLADVAAFEIAWAEAQGRNAAPRTKSGIPGSLRRHPAAVLLRSVYDIVPVLQERADEAAPHESFLAIALPDGEKAPELYVLSRELFELLELLDDFTDELAEIPDAVIARLTASGLIEIGR